MHAKDDQDIREAVRGALADLAERLGGSTDMGGPVEHAIQINGRGDFGVLLTDTEDRVLGRVWLAFGDSASVGEEDSSDGGQIPVEAELRSEVIDPPVPIVEWATGR